MSEPDARRLARLESDVEQLTAENDRLKAEIAVLRRQVQSLAADRERTLAILAERFIT